jgi:hypothetical protein
MTRDKILKLAEEADAYNDAMDIGGKSTPTLRDEYFAALVAAHEREECLNCYSPDDTATDWADKIRARGQ